MRRSPTARHCVRRLRFRSAPIWNNCVYLERAARYRCRASSHSGSEKPTNTPSASDHARMVPTVCSVTALTCCFVEKSGYRALLANVLASSFTSAASLSVDTTRFTKPAAFASAGSNSRYVQTSSLVSAGPISRTSRGIPPHARPIPRSTSGMEKRAVSVATRRSHAAANTKAPPTHHP